MMKALRIGLLLAAATAVALAGCSKEESKEPGADRPEGGMAEALDPTDQTVAVVVNGEDITKGQIAEEVARLSRQFGGMSPEQMGEMQGALGGQATDNLISRRLVEQRIKEEGITVSPEEVDERMAEVMANFGSEEELSERLAMMGVTVDMVKHEMETGLAVEKLLARHIPQAEVTDADTRAYYDDNPGQFTQPERVGASHILVKTEDTDTEAVKQEARSEAERLLGELKGGADFAQLAAEHSDCPSSANGGDVGLFGRGQMVKPFEDAAFAMGIGEISDVVETQFGYHIIKVTEREEEQMVAFDEVEEDIAAMLDAQRKQEALKAYTDQLRAEANIEYKDKE